MKPYFAAGDTSLRRRQSITRPIGHTSLPERIHHDPPGSLRSPSPFTQRGLLAAPLRSPPCVTGGRARKGQGGSFLLALQGHIASKIYRAAAGTSIYRVLSVPPPCHPERSRRRRRRICERRRAWRAAFLRRKLLRSEVLRLRCASLRMTSCFVCAKRKQKAAKPGRAIRESLPTVPKAFPSEGKWGYAFCKRTLAVDEVCFAGRASPSPTVPEVTTVVGAGLVPPADCNKKAAPKDRIY